jgi:glycosyltransferase involved in cell wall biosynthesis
MKVLLSAYACEPDKGSEPGVGWRWATELAGLGHEVTVITRSNNRASIDKALAKTRFAGLSFYYYDLRPWAKWWKHGSQGLHLYYWLWQRGAYHLARKLASKTQFDLVHHITFGVFRQPSFMGRLGLPFVIGPLGGGDLTPRLLRGGIPSADAFKERLRELSNHLAYLDPSLSRMYKQATLIFWKTPETLAVLPHFCREKSRVQLEIGLEPEHIMSEAGVPVARAEFLYAGRLLHLKGLHLAFKAFSELRRNQPDATFTVIGTGPAEAWLKKLSTALGLGDSVKWLGWISHEEIWAHYGHYTAFVFPSLHDSSGNVVLEALSQALPVICLDTGGPGAILPLSCGIKVAVKNRSESEVIHDLAEAMRKLVSDSELRAQMGREALAAAKANTWRNVVSQTYAQIDSVLDASRKRLADRTN